MAKNEASAATAATKTTRKPRIPRELSDLEKEAKQQFEDAKALTKLLPAIEKLGPWGFGKLVEAVQKQSAAAQTS